MILYQILKIETFDRLLHTIYNSFRKGICCPQPNFSTIKVVPTRREGFYRNRVQLQTFFWDISMDDLHLAKIRSSDKKTCIKLYFSIPVNESSFILCLWRVQFCRFQALELEGYRQRNRSAHGYNQVVFLSCQNKTHYHNVVRQFAAF
jgi:hypothetical protein